MAKNWTHRKACRMCNSRHVVPSLKFASTPPAVYDSGAAPNHDASSSLDNRIPLVVSLCEKCHLVQCLDVVKPELLFNLYPCVEPTKDSHGFNENLAQKIIATGKLGKGDLVIDVGCGNCDLLVILREKGLRVAGVDPSAHSRSAAEKLGISHYQEYFSPATASKLVKDHGPASAVVSSFTLGSIDNLHAVCAGVRYALKPDGVLHIAEPYLPDLLSRVSLGQVNHERITFFSLIPLDSFFRTVHLHMFDARKISTGTSCIHISIQRSDGKHVISPELGKLVDEEKAQGIHALARLNTFAAAAEDKKNAIRLAVESARTKNLLVAGYGFNNSALTLIHEFNWGPESLSGMIDDAVHQPGSTVPNTSIPVISWDDARKQGVGAIIVLGDPSSGGTNPDRIAAFKSAGGVVIALD